MRLTLLVISFLIRMAVAQPLEDSSVVHPPLDRPGCPVDSLSRVLSPRICPDGVAIGNVKFFIRILKTDPSIDPGMIKMIPDYQGFDHTPELPGPFVIPHPQFTPSPQLK